MTSNSFQIYTINSYFDFDDIEDPVKEYLQSIDVAPLTPEVANTVIVDVNQNKAILNDEWFLGASSKEVKFYTNQYSSGYVTSSSQYEDYLLVVSFRLDGKTNIYERTSLNLLELFGMLGGIYELIEVTFKMLLASLGQKVLNNTLLSNLYHIKSSKASKSYTLSTKQTTKVVPVKQSFEKKPTLIMEESK